MKLPNNFINLIQEIFEDDIEKADFLKSLQTKPLVSIRFNPSKVAKLFPEGLEFSKPSDLEILLQKHYPNHIVFSQIKSPVKWHPWGYYLKNRPAFSKDLFWKLGLYYVQEPASMMIAKVSSHILDYSKPNLKILDLSASPGGKSTLILDLLKPQDFLITNDVVPSRTRILRENIIKWGSNNCVVTNGQPRDLFFFEEYFDLILIDAPCSGEGLWRKQEYSYKQWSLRKVEGCQLRQTQILDQAVKLLKPGGKLIYSTCTYNNLENEDVVDDLLLKYPEMKRVYTRNLSKKLKTFNYSTFRCMQHLLQGEGLTFSLLEKANKLEQHSLKSKNFKPKKNKERSFKLLTKSEKNLIELLFSKKTLEQLLFLKVEEEVWAIEQTIYQEIKKYLPKLNFYSLGIFIGTLKKGTFKPDPNLFLANLEFNSNFVFYLSENQKEKYLGKQAFYSNNQEDGWYFVKYNSYFLGLARASKGVFKNHLSQLLLI